mmetsp:Transcript_110740/g.319948  ORF Transcript_110740/g.319948 Transcript_110740/m.319948 type:complete len:353 (+) Transcript_110740:1028-2086(+)
MGQTTSADAPEGARQTLNPRPRILGNPLGVEVVVLVLPHLALALFQRETILVVRPISDQQLQMAEGGASTGVVARDRLREGSEVVQVFQLVLLDAILDIEDHLRRQQRREPENCGALRLGHLVVVRALCVHQEDANAAPGGVLKDEGVAPKPNALCTTVLPRAPDETGLALVGLRALRDPSGVALQDPCRRCLRDGLVAELPRLRCLRKGMGSGRTLASVLWHRALRPFLRHGTLWRLRLGIRCRPPLFHGSLLREHLSPSQIPHHEVEEETLPGPVAAHNADNGDHGATGGLQVRADLSQGVWYELHLDGTLLQLQHLHWFCRFGWRFFSRKHHPRSSAPSRCGPTQLWHN